MCLSIWPTHRRSFRWGSWLVTCCTVLSALGHDNEAGACVWSVSATVVDISEKRTQLLDWEADGSQVLRNCKQNVLIHELKTKDAQLWVTSTQGPDVCVSLQATKTQTRWGAANDLNNGWLYSFWGGGKESCFFLDVTQRGLILTDVSGKPMGGPVFKCQGIREALLDSWWWER